MPRKFGLFIFADQAAVQPTDLHRAWERAAVKVVTALQDDAKILKGG